MIDIIFKLPKAEIIGMDNYKPDLVIAKKRFLDKVDFLYSDCLDMKIETESIDIVLSNQVIEHIPSMKKYLLEIERILKSNGLFIISTPNFHNPKNTLLKIFFKDQL